MWQNDFIFLWRTLLFFSMPETIFWDKLFTKVSRLCQSILPSSDWRMHFSGNGLILFDWYLWLEMKYTNLIKREDPECQWIWNDLLISIKINYTELLKKGPDHNLFIYCVIQLGICMTTFLILIVSGHGKHCYRWWRTNFIYSRGKPWCCCRCYYLCCRNYYIQMVQIISNS